MDKNTYIRIHFLRNELQILLDKVLLGHILECSFSMIVVRHIMHLSHALYLTEYFPIVKLNW